MHTVLITKPSMSQSNPYRYCVCEHGNACHRDMLDMIDCLLILVFAYIAG